MRSLVFLLQHYICYTLLRHENGTISCYFDPNLSPLLIFSTHSALNVFYICSVTNISHTTFLLKEIPLTLCHENIKGSPKHYLLCSVKNKYFSSGLSLIKYQLPSSNLHDEAQSGTIILRYLKTQRISGLSLIIIHKKSNNL